MKNIILVSVSAVIFCSVCAFARENGFETNAAARLTAAAELSRSEIAFERNSGISAVIAQAKSLNMFLPQAAQPKAVSAADSLSGQITLEDITKQCTSKDEVVSAFPELYARIPNEENAGIRKVFSFYENGIKDGAKLRRIELFYTGGDWMQYGLTYFITNTGTNDNTPKVYFMNDLSTTDREEGAIAPKVNPFSDTALQDFILARFLDHSGKTRPDFSPLF